MVENGRHISRAREAELYLANERAISEALQTISSHFDSQTLGQRRLDRSNHEWLVDLVGERQDVELRRVGADRAIVESIVATHTYTEYPKGQSPIYHPANITWQDHEKGTLIDKGRAPATRLNKVITSLFPGYLRPTLVENTVYEPEAISHVKGQRQVRQSGR